MVVTSILFLLTGHVIFFDHLKKETQQKFKWIL